MTDKARRANELFDSILFAWSKGNLHQSDLSIALEAIDYIVESLVAGKPSRHVMLMLSTFLEKHANEFAREHLGASLKGRPRASMAARVTGLTFEFAIECGMTESEALVLAYGAGLWLTAWVLRNQPCYRPWVSLLPLPLTTYTRHRRQERQSKCHST